MRIISIVIFLFISSFVYAQEFAEEEVQTDSLFSLNETEQHTSIKPLRVGLRIGVPNLITGNIEYVTPLFDNRVALTVDYMGITRSFTEGIFRFDNFEAGANVYFNNKGKGLYGSILISHFEVVLVSKIINSRKISEVMEELISTSILSILKIGRASC